MGEPMLSLEEARERILAAVKPAAPKSLPLQEALGLRAAEILYAQVDLPPFDNSSMDGYAVRAADLAEARAERPVTLRVTEKIPAGGEAGASLEPGACARIFTGARLPPGADAVVMQEDVKTDAAQPGVAAFCETPRPWENIRFRGEDVKRMARLTHIGTTLAAPRLGLLAAQGFQDVRVYPRPVLGMIATGDELREGGGSLMPGQIYESNRVALGALAERAGAKPKIFPLAPDELPATKTALERAFAECDAVVTTGGVSVGEMDFVKAAFAELGGQIDFWRIAIKPGKPFAFGQWNGKLLFGLPGNPVSAFVTFYLLVCPAVKIMLGAKSAELPRVTRVLAEPLANEGERRHFMRVRVDAKEVRLAGPQASHRLASLANATGLVDVPPKTTLPAGTEVEVLYW